ncbi:PREDICTED: uncharacterized protein LOC101314467 [Fragaria vesca subsp. vesca]|uniref:uncharacterized protein LOC101314467 n=1 Tax=Fragaria vesca subsp. vesca TaxID=101020 RepID=UPI0002C374DB|nr:PREDICTED: uncharacterized protein LOC101314467 [Fragaria vesca subsp. vesca]
MANRTTHRRILATPQPEPEPPRLRQTKPSTPLDPTKPCSRLNPSHKTHTTQRPSSQNPLPTVMHTTSVEKQSKEKLPKKPNREVKAEEVVVKMELMGLKEEKQEDEYESRRLSTSSSSSKSLGGRGRRSSFSGPPQAEMNRLADVFASNGVKVVSVDMPPFMQIHAVECARKTCDSLEKFTSKTLALTLKKEFDGVYGPAWHCIVGTSFGSFVTHSVSGFMYFSMDQKLYILLFKTTVQRAD